MEVKENSAKKVTPEWRPGDLEDIWERGGPDRGDSKRPGPREGHRGPREAEEKPGGRRREGGVESNPAGLAFWKYKIATKNLPPEATRISFRNQGARYPKSMWTTLSHLGENKHVLRGRSEQGRLVGQHAQCPRQAPPPRARQRGHPQEVLQGLTSGGRQLLPAGTAPGHTAALPLGPAARDGPAQKQSAWQVEIGGRGRGQGRLKPPPQESGTCCQPLARGSEAKPC